MPRAIVLGLLPIVLVVCGCRSVDTSRTVVATINGEPVYLSELEAYFESNLLEDHLDVASEGRNRLNSRLLDALVEERLLLAEALRRDLEVAPIEVDAWLDFAGEDEDERTDARTRELAERNLLLQKLEEDVASGQPEPDEAEIRTWIADRPEMFAVRTRVRLRSLRLETAESANAVHRQITRRRITFDEAVVVHADSPEQGVTVEIPLDEMIELHRTAIEGLKPGQVSSPVETNGGFHLFEVVTWMRGPGIPTDEQWHEARAGLLRERGREAFHRFVEELRRKSEIKLKKRSLPFEYLPEDSAP